MHILVLGGCGIQGRTALHDLAADPEVTRILCADQRFEDLDQIRPFTDMDKITPVPVDAHNESALVDLFSRADVVIDLLPVDFNQTVYSAAVKAGVSVVNTVYLHENSELDAQAKQAGIAIMPECGLDPGIDLVIYGDAKERFDELHVVNSYCGGFPEKKACTNPLKYKVSWIWRGVLNSTQRDARLIKNGTIIDVPAANQHDPDYVHSIDFPGLGTLEAIPNGDAVFFTDLLDATPTIRETGRYSLRWPGWSDFWRPIKQLGFLDDEPVKGFDCEVTPIDFLDKFLGPRLVYENDEKDLAAMINIFEGLKDGRRIRLTISMIIERDIGTGIMAMSKGVGYSAAIVAKMIARGDIRHKGLLSPMRHIPVEQFMQSLKKRGIQIKEETTVLS